MTNLIQLNPEQNPEEMVLHHFETEEFGIKIDLATNIVWAMTRDLPEILLVPRSTLQRHLHLGPKDGELTELQDFLRKHAVSHLPITARLYKGRNGQAWDINQIELMAEFYGSKLLENTRTFGLNSKLLAAVGYKSVVIKPADQVIISQAEADIESIKRLMGGVINTALALPGYNALGNSVGWVEPNFYKPSLTAREWVETHHADSPLFSRASMVCIGRAFSSAVIQNHQQLATNSWTSTNNKYQEIHHQVLCTSFHNLSRLGLIA